MSAYNGRFELATWGGYPIAGVLGVGVGGMAALLAFLFLAYPVIAVLCVVVSIVAFTIGRVAFRLGHDAGFFMVILYHWRHRKLTTLDNRGP